MIGIRLAALTVSLGALVATCVLETDCRLQLVGMLIRVTTVLSLTYNNEKMTGPIVDVNQLRRVEVLLAAANPRLKLRVPYHWPCPGL